ncbi:MAG TPA: protein kinase [Thermoanaerobaculia bacterium]
MSIAAGTRLGPYEVISLIGAGGMGEVWKARDTRLERTVAVKVLPERLSLSPESRQRFEREAKTISALSDPHICTLYDVGNQDGVEYLVMEYLEGETLSDRLAKGTLPFDLVLRYGIEIAQALEKAHRQGIVHRDLKPGNVMLTKSGVKLLDFGLAKAVAPADQPGALTSLPTAMPVSNLTEKGTILGTFQYMAPEQLEGKEADARTDIFALGAVLYEMATGKKAFSGATQASLITAIMSSDPVPISQLQSTSPPALDYVVKTCLAKSPDDRWQSAADVKQALGLTSQSSSSAAGSVAPFRRRGRWRILLAVLAIPALIVLGFLLGRSTSPRAAATPVVSFSLSPSPGESFASGGLVLAFSPNGRTIAIVVRREGTTQISIRDVGSFDPKLLAGTEGATFPFFSPDGAWLGFYADGKLKKIPSAGGPVIVLCSAPEGAGATWLPDDTIVFSPDWREGLQRVPGAGGAPKILTQPDPARGENYHWLPEALPDGSAVLFTDQKGASGSPGEANVATLSLQTGKWQTIIEKGTNAHYLVGGYIVYERDGVLLAAPFDARRLSVTGPSVPVLQGALVDPDYGTTQVAISRSGSVAYLAGTAAPPESTLVVVDRAGNERPLTGLRRPYEDLALSPDGRLLALTIIGEPLNVWLYDLARDTLNRFTFEGDNRDPIWSSDSRRVIYVAGRQNRFHLRWKPIDGSGPEEELVTTEKVPWPFSCSPDGRWLSYCAGNTVYLLPLIGEDRKLRAGASGPYTLGGSISPDGKWIAYQSSESGQSEVYVQALAGAGKWQISSAGGIRPHWASDGSELFFRSGSQGGRSSLMSVPIQQGPTFNAGTPRPLFPFHYLQGGHDYAVMPDGQHFICIKRPEVEAGSIRANVIVNFAAELK